MLVLVQSTREITACLSILRVPWSQPNVVLYPQEAQPQNTTVTRAGENHHVHIQDQEASKPGMVVKSTRGSQHSRAGVVTACPALRFWHQSHPENHPVLDQGLKECPPSTGYSAQGGSLTSGSRSAAFSKTRTNQAKRWLVPPLEDASRVLVLNAARGLAYNFQRGVRQVSCRFSSLSTGYQ